MKKTNLFETLNNEELSFVKGGTATNLGAVVNNSIVDPDTDDDDIDDCKTAHRVERPGRP